MELAELPLPVTGTPFSWAISTASRAIKKYGAKPRSSIQDSLSPESGYHLLVEFAVPLSCAPDGQSEQLAVGIFTRS